MPIVEFEGSFLEHRYERFGSNEIS